MYVCVCVYCMCVFGCVFAQLLYAQRRKQLFPALPSMHSHSNALTTPVYLFPAASWLSSNAPINASPLHSGDPERMAPPKFAEYVSELFAGTCVKVRGCPSAL